MKALKVLHLISISALISAAPLLANAQDTKIYQCKDDDEMHIRLQDSPCGEGFEQVSVPMPLFSQAEPSSMLRPQELADLKSFNENWLMRKYFDYERRNLVSVENAQYRNAKSLEQLRHEHAKEMFEKSYRHFYMYGVSNGGGSFPLGYAPSGGDVQTFSQQNNPTISQGQNAGDVVNTGAGSINGVQQTGNNATQNNN